jgi:hypothetical protein
MLCENAGLSRGDAVNGINLWSCCLERRRLRKRYIAAQRSARPTAIPIAMPTYAAVESLLGRDASGIGDGLLTDEAVLLGVAVVVMVLDGTILF